MANAELSAPIPANERFVLHGVSWQTNADLCGNVGDLPIRLTFDGSSRLNRPAIYAALRVPEIWRFDGEILHVELLQADGRYRPSETSLSFPFLPVHELARFLAQAEQKRVSTALRSFAEWVREQRFVV